MSTLDARIDELYALPLAEFTAARNALAKTVKGDDAKRVKRLEKPSLVPWAVNQLYWRERRTYDRLIASGEALRTAQIAALKGRTSDVRGATTAHRAAVAAAVATANQLAAQAGARPSVEPLSRMLEALSLSPDPPAPPGRFTELLQPAGFEALVGVTPVARPHPSSPQQHRETTVPQQHGETNRPQPASKKKASRTDAASERRRAAAAEAAAEAAAAAARKVAEAAVQTARRQLEHAQTAEGHARQKADAAREQLRSAEDALAHAREATARAASELTSAEAALSRL